MKPIHERMPVILRASEYDEWLTTTDSLRAQELLVPYKRNDITMDKVSREVNRPQNDNVALITPIG